MLAIACPTASAQAPASCPGSFEVMHFDQIGALELTPRPILDNGAEPGRADVRRRAELFRQFLEDYDGETWRRLEAERGDQDVQPRRRRVPGAADDRPARAAVEAGVPVLLPRAAQRPHRQLRHRKGPLPDRPAVGRVDLMRARQHALRPLPPGLRRDPAPALACRLGNRQRSRAGTATSASGSSRGPGRCHPGRRPAIIPRTDGGAPAPSGCSTATASAGSRCAPAHTSSRGSAAAARPARGPRSCSRASSRTSRATCRARGC